jgi:hypothetical protein
VGINLLRLILMRSGSSSRIRLTCLRVTSAATCLLVINSAILGPCSTLPVLITLILKIILILLFLSTLGE